MGRDKGLLETDGVPWAIRMGDKLTPWCIPVVYSINDKQQATYSAILPPELLITDALGLPGPLNGLFSVHERYPGLDLLLLACDMPDLGEDAFRTLIEAWRNGMDQQHPPAFYAYRDGHFFQPFCAIYTAAGLAPMHRLARTGALTEFSLQALLNSSGTMELPITEPGSFRNYNTI